MIKNNFLGQTLLGLLLIFMLISSIQMFGWGQGLKDVEADQLTQNDVPKLPAGIKKIANTENSDKVDSNELLQNIIKRPMFSDTRTPFVPEPDAEPEKVVEEVAVKELKAQLTGVVITPEQSYAMILDNITNQRETYKVGMPLSGEQGGWVLDSIQSRKVVFVSDDKKTEELKLEIFAGAIKKSVKGKAVKNNKANKGKRPLSKKDKKKNADDIRKKIAERRAQMRAQAAKKKKK